MGLPSPQGAPVSRPGTLSCICTHTRTHAHLHTHLYTHPPPGPAHRQPDPWRSPFPAPAGTGPCLWRSGYGLLMPALLTASWQGGARQKSSGQSLLQGEQLLSCTQPSPHGREKTSVLSLCVLPDRDECEQPSTCRGQQCINTPGSYRCECKDGFAMGSRGQCEGEACCSLFPCHSKPPCAGLNTSFSHHSMCPPRREEEPSLVCVPCAPLKGCLPSPLPAGGTGFPGLQKARSPEILSHLPREIPQNQPMLVSYSGRRCPCVSCQLDSVTRPSCWQAVCKESRLQRLRPPVPTASCSSGTTWLLHSIHEHMMCLIKDPPFSVAHLQQREGDYFRRQYGKQDMQRMLLPPLGLQKALALRTSCWRMRPNHGYESP